jgi:HlyD family secretion protein
MSKPVKFTIAGVVVAVIAAVGVMGASKRGNKAVEVRMEQVARRDLVASVTASGQVQPRSKVDVSADVTGRIVRLAVKEGDLVTKGQFLLQIDPIQSEAAVQRAQAQVSAAQAQAAQARANWIQASRVFERQAEVKKQNPNLISDQELETLRTTSDVNKELYDAAMHQVAQASAGLRDARRGLERTTIIAPMSGKVTRLNVEEGEVAVPGTFNKELGTLLTISDMNVLETKVKVDETDVARIALGDSTVVQIDAFGQGRHVGAAGRRPGDRLRGDDPAAQRAGGDAPRLLGHGEGRDRHPPARALHPDHRADRARERGRGQGRHGRGGGRPAAAEAGGQEGRRGRLRGRGRQQGAVPPREGRHRRREVLRGRHRPEGGRQDRRRHLPGHSRAEGRRAGAPGG